MVFLVFLGMGPHVWAEGIIPVICATEQFKGCKNIDTIIEYPWGEFISQNSRWPDKAYEFKDDIIIEYSWGEFISQNSRWPNKAYVIKKVEN